MTTAPQTPQTKAATSREMHFFLAGWNGAVLNVDATEHFQKAQASAQKCVATPAEDSPVVLHEPVAYLHPKGTCATTDLWYKEAGWLPLFTEQQLCPLLAGVSEPAAQAQADAPDGWLLDNSRVLQLDSRLVRRLRCSALDLADPEIRADATRLEQERNTAIKRLAPYIEDLVALAWAQAQSSGASSGSSKEAP